MSPSIEFSWSTFLIVVWLILGSWFLFGQSKYDVQFLYLTSQRWCLKKQFPSQIILNSYKHRSHFLHWGMGCSLCGIRNFFGVVSPPCLHFGLKNSCRLTPSLNIFLINTMCPTFDKNLALADFLLNFVCSDNVYVSPTGGFELWTSQRLQHSVKISYAERLDNCKINL